VHLISVRHFYLPQIKQFRGLTELTISPHLQNTSKAPAQASSFDSLASSEHLQEECEKKTSASAT
jgi:hypothetical protein